MHSNRLNNPYRRDAGRSNSSAQSVNDLIAELGDLLDRKHASPRATHDQYYSLRSVLAKNDAKRAGARRGLRDEYWQSRDRDDHVSQFGDEDRFHRHGERPYDAQSYDTKSYDTGPYDSKSYDAKSYDTRYAARPRAAHDESDYSDRYDAAGPHDEEMYDEPPRKQRRSLVTVLALIGFAMAGTAGAYAYRTYYSEPPPTQASASASPAKSAQPGVRGAPPAAAAGYVVQVSSQRSKADAEASYRSLQERFPRQLAGRPAVIRRADLGTKGVFYRAVVGPFASAGEADQFCGRFRAAGGQCITQRN